MKKPIVCIGAALVDELFHTSEPILKATTNNAKVSRTPGGVARNIAHQLALLDVPTQLIWGAHDRVVSVDYGRQWQQALPDARMQVIEDAGHYPHIEQPEAFVRTLEQFVDSLPAA